MDPAIIKEFIVAYYNIAYNQKFELSKFYSEKAKVLRSSKNHEANLIKTNTNLWLLPKESSITILRYGYSMISDETASIVVTGTIETKNSISTFNQNFILKLISEETESQTDSAPNNNNSATSNEPKRYEIISDIFFDIKNPNGKPNNSSPAETIKIPSTNSNESKEAPQQSKGSTSKNKGENKNKFTYTPPKDSDAPKQDNKSNTKDSSVANETPAKTTTQQSKGSTNKNRGYGKNKFTYTPPKDSDAPKQDNKSNTKDSSVANETPAKTTTQQSKGSTNKNRGYGKNKFTYTPPKDSDAPKQDNNSNTSKDNTVQSTTPTPTAQPKDTQSNTGGQNTVKSESAAPANNSQPNAKNDKFRYRPE